MEKVRKLEKKDIHLNEIEASEGIIEYKIFGNKHEQILRFQDCNPFEGGVTGVTNEDLYKILIDRLEVFAVGELSTPQTVKQLELVREALKLNDERLQDRYDRGVIGSQEK